MKKYTTYISLLLIGIAAFYISYFIDRGEFLKLVIAIVIAFGGCFYLITHNVLSKKQIIGWSIFFRLILVFNTPNLSDDYYRFIWDGEMINKGKNPYLHLPQDVIEEKDFKNSEYFNELYEGLNSKQYYTVYPPLNQVVFYVASSLGSNIYYSIVILKLILLLFEMGILFILFKLLKQLKLSENLAVIYGLNPLVIIEIVGNVHFEGMMLFFFLFGVLMLFKNKVLYAGILFAFAINTKLIPLMLLPFVVGLIGWKRSIVFYSIIGVISFLLFFPFYNNELLVNFGSSIDLYFQKFEFNASVYYILRWIGIELTGYNQIGVIGDFLPLVMVGVIVFLFFKQFNLKDKKLGFIQYTFYILFIYYLLASIVHPWYVINLVLLSVFIQNRMALIWSFTVFLSYFAYSNYIESNYEGDKHLSSLYFFLVCVEYLSLLGYVLYRKFRA